MNNQELAKMIAEEVGKAIAPLYDRMDRIEAGKQLAQEVTEPAFEKGYFRSHYEKTGRIKKQK